MLSWQHSRFQLNSLPGEKRTVVHDHLLAGVTLPCKRIWQVLLLIFARASCETSKLGIILIADTFWFVRLRKHFCLVSIILLFWQPIVARQVNSRNKREKRDHKYCLENIIFFNWISIGVDKLRRIPWLDGSWPFARCSLPQVNAFDKYCFSSLRELLVKHPSSRHNPPLQTHSGLCCGKSIFVWFSHFLLFVPIWSCAAGQLTERKNKQTNVWPLPVFNWIFFLARTHSTNSLPREKRTVVHDHLFGVCCSSFRELLAKHPSSA